MKYLEVLKADDPREDVVKTMMCLCIISTSFKEIPHLLLYPQTVSVSVNTVDI